MARRPIAAPFVSMDGCISTRKSVVTVKASQKARGVATSEG
jgi:hypothetical protein